MENSTPPIIYGKPFSHIGVPDWESRILQNHQTNDTRRSDAFNLRYESKKLRDEKHIQTIWNTYRSNVNLDERVTEIRNWKEFLEFCLDSTRKELNELKKEKYLTERKLDSLDNPVAVILECITIRDQRRSSELTNDVVEEELKKEICLVQLMRKLLADHCHTAWEKINALEDLIFKLDNEISDKEQVLEVDNAQLNLNRNCAQITLKTEPLATVKRSITHDSWVRNLEIIKQIVEDQLTHSRQVRGDLFAMRERAKNEMLEKHELVEFHLRKRIFLTKKMKSEIHWHQMKMEEEMGKVAEEIRALENALEDKIDPTKLVETRLENRALRHGLEITTDNPDANLKDELIQLRQTKKELMEKIAQARATYNALEEQKVLIDKDLDDKNHTLDVDIKCLDTRNRLRASIVFDEENPRS